MGFFTHPKNALAIIASPLSQSLSGWDGVFHTMAIQGKRELNAQSQSLSGWDGVFHFPSSSSGGARRTVSQSLSGWDGVFH